MISFDLAVCGSSVTGLVAASGGVNLDFDNTVILQAILFTVLLLILKPLLFDPMLRIFALREELTEGARTTARNLQEQAGDLLTKYEEELGRVARVAAAERDRSRAETARLESEILGEAREATTRILEEGRARIAAEATAIRFELGQESERGADAIVAHFLRSGAS